MLGVGREREFLSSLFSTAVRAADPDSLMAMHLPPPPKGRVIVVGAGKAASQMARAFERVWNRPCEGVVVARHGPVEKTKFIRVLTAAHPVPDPALVYRSGRCQCLQCLCAIQAGSNS